MIKLLNLTHATQYDGIWAQVWCECPTKPIRSFAAARMAGTGPVAGLYCELANAGFWQKRPAVAAAERLLPDAALKHACTEPLVLAQKSGCYSLADVFARNRHLRVTGWSCGASADDRSRWSCAGWPVPLVKRPRAERHSYDQSAANRCSSTPTPKRKPS